MDSEVSMGQDRDLKRQQSFVHFDPTITVRECVSDDENEDAPADKESVEHEESNWFSEDELRSFMAEAVNVCHFSAVSAVKNYSLPAVKDAYQRAHRAGVTRPVLSTTQPDVPRALFADPCLHIADEDAVVHEGSERFFRIVAREVRRVLIVDNSPTATKLFRRNVLCMFPHVKVDVATSAEEALDMIEVHPKRASLNYDLILVEERLQQGITDEPSDLSGSELLRLVNEMELSASKSKARTSANGETKASSRRSLKIGVSVSLGEDCESLKNEGGADLFWSKPPPRPSNGLRNQILNALLAKRGKSVYICGC
jgi:hypothetical protein